MPEKAAYLEMENEPEAELWFALAELLGGRTVEEWQRAMSYDEWMHWSIYLARKGQRQELASKAGQGVV